MQLYVNEVGPADAPSIVFLHGGGLSGRMWGPQLDRLSEYHCIVPDLPEQGRSAHIAPFSLDDAAERVAELIKARSSRGRAHVVGLSLGGAVALTALRRSPELVERVVVSGTAAGLGRALGAISKASAGLYRLLKEETLVALSIKQFGIPPQHHGMFREDMLLGMKEDFVRNYTDALMAMRLPTETTAAVLVAVGQRETWAAKQAARKLVTTIPGARGVVAPRAGHVWNLEHPDLFTDMVRAWCEQTPLPPALGPL